MRLLARAARLRRDIAEGRRLAARQRAAEAPLLRQLARRIDEAKAAAPGDDAGSRTLVLGLAANYGIAELAPFARSLRGCGHAGEAVLLVANTAPETRRFLHALDIRTIPCDALALLPMSPNSARMLRYLDFLEERVLAPDGGTAHGRILLTDVRDVVFQDDPFARLAEGKAGDIHYFLEAPGRTIGGCPVNAHWMRQAFGAAGLRRHAAAPISCAGTLMARPRALRLYLLQMCRLILEAPPAARHSGIDQAIHNHLMLEGLVGETPCALPNGQIVATVPTDRPHGMRALPDGRLRNADGSLSAILHQYDRDPALRDAVLARWAAPARGAPCR